MNTLDEIAKKYKADKQSDYHGYTKRYEPYFELVRHMPIKILEIGVQFGHSIKTWLEYFPNAMVHGIDCHHEFNEYYSHYTFWLGDVNESEFWVRILRHLPQFKFIIDDGGHHAPEVITAFNHLWPKLESGGLYIIEDWCAVAYDDAFSIHGYDAKTWLSGLLGDLHHNGKQYYGKPNNPVSVNLNEMETTLDFIQCSKGLIIIGKK